MANAKVEEPETAANTAPMASITAIEPDVLPGIPDMTKIPVLPELFNAHLCQNILDNIDTFDAGEHDRCTSEPQEYAFDMWADSNISAIEDITDHRFADVAELRSCTAVKATVPVANVRVDRGGICLRTLWDSGASYTILTSRGLQRMRKAGINCPMFPPGRSAPTFILADGSKRRPSAQIRIRMYFEDYEYTHKAWLLEGGDFDMILGIDFFVRVGAQMNFAMDCQQITLAKIPGRPTVDFDIDTENDTFRGAVSPLFAPEAIIMQARKRYQTNLHTMDGDPIRAASSYEGIVERYGIGADARHCVAAALACVKNGVVRCEITNFTDRDIVVPKGALLGYFLPMETVSEDMLDAVSQFSPVMQPIVLATVGELEDMRKEGKEKPPAEEKKSQNPDRGVRTKARGRMVRKASRNASAARTENKHSKAKCKGETKATLAPVHMDELVPEKEDDPIGEDGIPKSLRAKLDVVRKAITAEQFERLEALIREYADVFARNYDKPEVNKHRPMRMATREEEMKPAKQRRYSPKERDLIREYCTKLLKAGVLEESESPWRNNILLIPKKDGGYRVCVDMRIANAATETIASNLPCLADNLDVLGGNKIFSTFDILSAFWSCELYEPHRKYTSFFAPGIGNLQFTRAAMGMCNSGTHFVSLTLDMFSNVLFEYVAAYADDILVYSKDIDEHIDVHLRTVLERFREYNVKLKGSKAELCVTELEWCGYRISTDGIHTDPKKIAAITGMKEIKTLKQLRSFLGSCNFLRRWINGYAKLVEPLRPLLQKGRFRRQKSLSEVQKKAISDLKDAISTAPALSHPQFDRPFHMYCDASTVALGAALCQKDDEGRTRVVSYLSKSLTKTQQGYHVNELEALSVLYALETWAPYFFGQENVDVFTDSDAACWIFKPDSKYSGRALRWTLRASRWPVKLHHLPGATNKLADMLSRCTSSEPSQAPKHVPANLVSAVVLSAATRQQRRREAERKKQNTPPPERERSQHGVRKKKKACFNCKRHQHEEKTCAEPCKACGDAGHTRIHCPKREQRDSDDTERKEAAYERNPWESLFPGCEFEDDILALRPDVVLWHRVPDKRSLFREHQQKDQEMRRIMDALRTAECHETCKNGVHAAKCIHAQWRLTEDQLLTRRTVGKPLPHDSHTIKILETWEDALCACSGQRCHDSCPRMGYQITYKNANDQIDKDPHKGTVTQDDGAGAEQDEVIRDPERDQGGGETSRISASPAVVRKDRRVHQGFETTKVQRVSFKLAVPASLITSVLYHGHGSGVAGHPGSTKTLSRVRRRFWWKGMRKDVRDWVAACLPCQQRKPPRPRNVGKPGKTKLPKGPMQEIYIDFAGPYPETDRCNRWILSIVCAYSRYPIAVPLPNRSAAVVARALIEHVVQHYSCPKLIISDAAKEFTGHIMEDFCRIFDIQKHTNVAYSPELSSYVERYHAWQGACLTIVTSRFKRDWDLVLPLVSLAYRTTVHASTGFTPFEALHGFEPRMPFDSWCPWNEDEEPRSVEMSSLQKRMREIYDAVKVAHDEAVSKNLETREDVHREREFRPGDIVLRFAPKSAEVLPKDVPNKQKMMDRWSLPGVVVAKGDRGIYIIRDADGKLTNERANTLRRYRFFKDGLPSVPQRRKFTKEERAKRNAALKRPKVAQPKQGQLVCFPMEMKRGPGFGIGKVLKIKKDGTFNLQFYSNDVESLRGAFRPCWLNTAGHWYAGERKSPTHREMTTDDFFPGPIRKHLLAAVNFKLMEDYRVPMPVLRAMSEHPDFQWSLPEYGDEEPW